MNYIADVIVEMKIKFSDPQLILAGDFSQWRIDQALTNFADLKEITIGNTRKDKSTDRMFMNITRSIVESRIPEPLETEKDRIPSDHRIAYFWLDLPRKPAFQWETFSYRHYCEQACKDFKSWIILNDWAKVFQ